MSLCTEFSDLLENRIKNELAKKNIIFFYPESRFGSYRHFKSMAIKNMKYGCAYHYSTYYEGLMIINFFVTYSGDLYSWLCSNKNLNHCFIYEGNISDFLFKNKSS